MNGTTAAPLATSQAIHVKYPKEENRPALEEPTKILISSVLLPWNLRTPILQDPIWTQMLQGSCKQWYCLDFLDFIIFVCVETSPKDTCLVFVHI